MYETMIAANCVSLAAPQIGTELRVIVVGFDRSSRYPNAIPVPMTTLINPHVDSLSDENGKGMRGTPLDPRHAQFGALGDAHSVSRCRREGAPVEPGSLRSPRSVVQHEADHLNGVLYPQRIADMTRFASPEPLPDERLARLREGLTWQIQRYTVQKPAACRDAATVCVTEMNEWQILGGGNGVLIVCFWVCTQSAAS